MDSESLVEEGTHQELIQQLGITSPHIPSRRLTLTDTNLTVKSTKPLPPKLQIWEGILPM